MKNALFDAWPYVTTALLTVGIVVRYLLVRKNISAIAVEISQARTLFRGSVLWRSSLVALLGLHLAVLALPAGVLSWNRSPVRLYLLESLALVAGLVTLVSCVRLLWAHVQRSTAPAIFEICDTVFFSLLLLGLLSGCLIAVLHRWASSWGAMTLAPYLQSLLHVQPAAALVAQMPFLVRLHVFCAFTAMAAFPLTRLAAVVVAVLHRVIGLAGRPLIKVGQGAESWLRRHSPASWLWPEED